MAIGDPKFSSAGKGGIADYDRIILESMAKLVDPSVAKEFFKSGKDLTNSFLSGADSQKKTAEETGAQIGQQLGESLSKSFASTFKSGFSSLIKSMGGQFDAAGSFGKGTNLAAELRSEFAKYSFGGNSLKDYSAALKDTYKSLKEEGILVDPNTIYGLYNQLGSLVSLTGSSNARLSSLLNVTTKLSQSAGFTNIGTYDSKYIISYFDEQVGPALLEALNSTTALVHQENSKMTKELSEYLTNQSNQNYRILDYVRSQTNLTQEDQSKLYNQLVEDYQQQYAYLLQAKSVSASDALEVAKLQSTIVDNSQKYANLFGSDAITAGLVQTELNKLRGYEGTNLSLASQDKSWMATNSQAMTSAIVSAFANNPMISEQFIAQTGISLSPSAIKALQDAGYGSTQQLYEEMSAYITNREYSDNDRKGVVQAVDKQNTVLNALNYELEILGLNIAEEAYEDQVVGWLAVLAGSVTGLIGKSGAGGTLGSIISGATQAAVANTLFGAGGASAGGMLGGLGTKLSGLLATPAAPVVAGIAGVAGASALLYSAAQKSLIVQQDSYAGIKALVDTSGSETGAAGGSSLGKSQQAVVTASYDVNTGKITYGQKIVSDDEVAANSAEVSRLEGIAASQYKQSHATEIQGLRNISGMPSDNPEQERLRQEAVSRSIDTYVQAQVSTNDKSVHQTSANNANAVYRTDLYSIYKNLGLLPSGNAGETEGLWADNYLKLKELAGQGKYINMSGMRNRAWERLWGTNKVNPADALDFDSAISASGTSLLTKLFPNASSDFTGMSSEDLTWAKLTKNLDIEFAQGTDNIPFDGYPAILHEGEMVIPARRANYIRKLLGMQLQNYSNVPANSSNGANSFVQGLPEYTNEADFMSGANIAQLASGVDSPHLLYKKRSASTQGRVNPELEKHLLDMTMGEGQNSLQISWGRRPWSETRGAKNSMHKLGLAADTHGWSNSLKQWGELKYGLIRNVFDPKNSGARKPDGWEPWHYSPLSYYGRNADGTYSRNMGFEALKNSTALGSYVDVPDGTKIGYDEIGSQPTYYSADGTETVTDLSQIPTEFTSLLKYKHYPFIADKLRRLGYQGPTTSDAAQTVSSPSLGSSLMKATMLAISNSEGNHSSVNANDNGSLSIGRMQWHAGRAGSMLQAMHDSDPAGFTSLASSLGLNNIIRNLGSKTYWDSYIPTGNSVGALSQLIGKYPHVQDAIFSKDIQAYMNHGQQSGVGSDAGLALWSNFENKMGYTGIHDIFRAGSDWNWGSMTPRVNSGNYSGRYLRTKNALSQYGIPLLEDGGIVQATPGGMLANIGEGKHDEAVIPLTDQHDYLGIKEIGVDIVEALDIVCDRICMRLDKIIDIGGTSKAPPAIQYVTAQRDKRMEALTSFSGTY